LDEGRYLAVLARDARFDGHFFTAVTSTGIYCRPVCAVRTPRRENCRFFVLAAQAENAGFRPCLRCRPELAPQALVWSVQDASGILVQQAVRLLDAPDLWPAPSAPGEGSATVARLAERLGVSDRHLRRIFEAALGVSPLQYLQTRRLLTAKQLLTDTPMPVTQVALASGFASVRRFNAAFSGHYGLNPTQLRRSGTTAGAQPTSTLRLAWRPPFDVPALLAFFERRQFHGVEWVLPEETTLRRTVRLPASCTGLPGETTGWFSARFDGARHQVLLQTSDSLYPVLPLVIRRVRAMLDLDADPAAINAVLHPHFPDGDGLRVPGAFDGFELAVRAVLGQQITVAAARTLGQRLVERLGEPIETPWPGLNRLFPTAATLALWRWPAPWMAARWPCTRAPTWPAPRPRCALCPVLATGRPSTSPCACCAGPMRFRPGMWRCTRPWACRGTRTRPAPQARPRRPGGPGAVTRCCAPGQRAPRRVPCHQLHQ
jgi:AraC family transcriptional regulator of adaptative response / DNA-3-methyladenine glycosylase II